MIVALEGPCLSGKTTARLEVERLLATQAHLIAFPCYVDELATAPPHPVARSSIEQIAAVKAFLEVETSRYDRVVASRPALVLIDRSIDTLAAHALGVERYLDRAASYSDTLSAIIAEPRKLIPDLTFFFAAPDAELERRSSVFPGLPAVYYHPAFLMGFRKHFAGANVFAKRIVQIDALGALRDIAAQIVRSIAELQAIKDS